MKYIEFSNVIISDTLFVSDKKVSILTDDSFQYKIGDPITINNNGNIFTKVLNKEEVYQVGFYLLKPNSNFFNYIFFDQVFCNLWYYLVDYSKVKNVEPIIITESDENYVNLNDNFYIDVFNGYSNGRPQLKYATLNKKIFFTIYELNITTDQYILTTDFENHNFEIFINNHLYRYKILDKFSKLLTLTLKLKSKDGIPILVSEKETFIIPIYDQYIEKLDLKYAFWLDF